LPRLAAVLTVYALVTTAVSLGLMILVVPGVWWACVSWLACPAAALERPGIFGAVGRSRALLTGHAFLPFVFMVVLWGLDRGIFSLLGDSPGASVWAFRIKLVGTLAFLDALRALLVTVTFLELRARKEGEVRQGELEHVFG
jgi:hypothetical protein